MSAWGSPAQERLVTTTPGGNVGSLLEGGPNARAGAESQGVGGMMLVGMGQRMQTRPPGREPRKGESGASGGRDQVVGLG